MLYPNLVQKITYVKFNIEYNIELSIDLDKKILIPCYIIQLVQAFSIVYNWYKLLTQYQRCCQEMLHGKKSYDAVNYSFHTHGYVINSCYLLSHMSTLETTAGLYHYLLCSTMIYPWTVLKQMQACPKFLHNTLRVFCLVKGNIYIYI